MTEAFPLTLLDAALRGCLVALLALLAAALLREQRGAALARIGVVLCAGLVVQVVSSTPNFEDTVPRLWQAPLVAISVGNAVLFWLFVQGLFDDDFELQPWHLAVWLAVAALSGYNCASAASTASTLGRVTLGLQRSVPLVFAVLAAAAAASTWRLDLVEKRRRLRAFIVVAGVAYTVGMLAIRLASPQGRLAGPTAIFDVAALLLLVTVVAFGLLRIGRSELLPQRDAVLDSTAAVATPPPSGGALVATRPPPSTDPAEERLATALDRLVRDEHVYRVEGLTVAGLAERLRVPEYRLRRLINQRLGHRNFNAFINAFRLDEARSSLADPAQRELPVLTIALEAGFQSIGPFNRAFKAATGVTPTEFRRQNLADS